MMNETPRKRTPDAAGQIVLLFGAGLIFFLSLLAQLSAWTVGDARSFQFEQPDARPAFAAALLAAVAIYVYCRLFSRGAKRLARYRAVLDTWALAAVFQLFMLPLRLFAPLYSAEIAAYTHLIQFAGLLLYWLLLTAIASSRGIPNLPRRPAGWIPWFAVGLIMPLWFWSGTFGSLSELAMGCVVGLFVGFVVAELVGNFLLPNLLADPRGAGWDMLLTAVALGGTLTIFGSALGVSGQIQLLGFLLPILAWPLSGMVRMGTNKPAQNVSVISWVVGLATAIVLVSADADETSILFGFDSTEVYAQLQQALGVSAVVSTIFAVMLWLMRNRLPQWQPSTLLKALTVICWVGAFVMLLVKPNRGLHGDRLFVEFERQMDLSDATTIQEIDARRDYVYRTQVSQANLDQREMRQALDFIGADYQSYYLINGISVRGGLLMRLWLLTFDGVERIIDDPQLRPVPQPLAFGAAQTMSSDSDSPPSDLPWGLEAIGADRVWDELGVRGAGIVVGESDSGVEWDHPELLDGYRGRDVGQGVDHNYNWLDAWENEPIPYDPMGHGTHTTATAVGNNVGVAPDAEWFGCANLVRNLASPSLYLDCMQFMLAPYPLNADPLVDGDPRLAADVLNNSWGCPRIEGCDAESLRVGTEALRAAGIFVVVSAGNSGDGGCGTVSAPIAIYDATFSVGATNQAGNVTGFSSRGPVTVDGSGRIKPDIVAPGADVISALPNGLYGANQGTSMAGPHVAGVVALMWSAEPRLIGDIDRTEEILIATATPIELDEREDDCGNVRNVTGHGLVNAYEAVRMALGIETAER